jgi:hypothetical protein
MFALFIQGPGPELRFLAIRSKREEAEAALRAFAEEIGRNDPHRDVNAFVVECSYFSLHGGQMARGEYPTEDLNFSVLDRYAAAELGDESRTSWRFPGDEEAPHDR